MLQKELKYSVHIELDVRNRHGIMDIVKRIRADAIVQTAAQPSHDCAAEIPFDDFDANAGATLNLLEATRPYSTEILIVLLRQ